MLVQIIGTVRMQIFGTVQMQIFGTVQMQIFGTVRMTGQAMRGGHAAVLFSSRSTGINVTTGSRKPTSSCSDWTRVL